MGQAMALDLVDASSDHVDEIALGYRTGPEGLLAALRALRNLGVHHVAFNLLVAHSADHRDACSSAAAEPGHKTAGVAMICGVSD
jgi:hypothetical protein